MMREHKRSIFLIVILLVLFVWIGSCSLILYADYPYYSPNELEEQADMIVIGTVERPILEKETANIGHSGITDWEVTVKEYLKVTGPLYEKIVVTTPGNRTKRGVYTSTDYALDDQGPEALLFIEVNDSTLRPITPGAVIGMIGDEIRNFYGNPADKNQLLTMLENRERFAPVKGSVSEKYEQLMEKEKSTSAVNFTSIVIVILVSLGIVIALFIIYAKRKAAH